MNRLFLPLAVAGLALMTVACGGEGGPRIETSSSSQEPAATGPPITSAAAEPTQQLDLPAQKIIFVRQQTATFGPSGTLWMSDANGSHQMQLTPDGVRATFAGSDANGGRTLTYYVSFDDQTNRTLWRLDLGTQERSALTKFSSPWEYDGFAALSPEGRYLAFVDLDSLKLLDLHTRDTRLLLQGNYAGCNAAGAGRCFVYRSAIWSPNGLLVAVTKGYYEGSRPVVIDPFAEPVTEVEIGTDSLAPHAWSPDSAALCASHSYGGTDLYVTHAPDWQVDDLVSEYAAVGQPGPRTDRRVAGCDWLDTSKIAFVAVAGYSSGVDFALPKWSVEVGVYDFSNGSPSTIATMQDEIQMTAGGIFALDSGHALFQYWVDSEGRGVFTASQPNIIDVTTGDRQPILQKGDSVVAVTGR